MKPARVERGAEQLNPEEDTTVTPQDEREGLRMSRRSRRSRMEGGGLEAR